jgi:hypothetical protein
MPGEHLVVGRHAVVHVHQLAGDVAVGRVGVVRRQDLVRLIRGGILFQRRLGELRLVRLGRDQLDHAHFRRREQDVEALDGRLVAPRAEQRGDELGVLLPVGRPGMMRTCGHSLHPGAQVLAIELRVELPFQRLLLRRIGEAVDRLRRLDMHLRRGRQRHGEEEKQGEEFAHGAGFYASSSLSL